MNAQEFIKLHTSVPPNEVVINLFIGPEWSNEIRDQLTEYFCRLEDMCTVSTWCSMMRHAQQSEFRSRLMELVSVHPGCTDYVVDVMHRNGF